MLKESVYSLGHFFASWQAVRSSWSLSRWISPLSSAMGMKVSGSVVARTWRHRVCVPPLTA
jgi:hypothetical protein